MQCTYLLLEKGGPCFWLLLETIREGMTGERCIALSMAVSLR